MGTVNRRKFLHLLGGAAVTGAIAGIPRAAFAETVAQVNRSLRPALIFFDPDFPEIEGIGATREVLSQALEGFQVTYAGAHELADALGGKEDRLLITAHGSAFPKDAWNALKKFLLRGGNWLNLGGRPLMSPFRREGGEWRAEIPQMAYLRQLGITACVVNEDAVPRAWKVHGESVEGLAEAFDARETYSLTLKLTEGKDFPDEDGSAGPREAVVRPLVHGYDPAGIPVASPFVSIDRLAGRYAGGRWVFAALQGRLSGSGIRTLAEYAGNHACEMIVSPSRASYHTGERIFLGATIRPGRTEVHGDGIPCDITVLDGRGEEVGSTSFRLLSQSGVLKGMGELRRAGLPPGLYTMRARARIPGLKQVQTRAMGAENGFVISGAGVSGGTPITHDGSTFYRGGLPFPVTGTTYMAGDVHRKFLLEPNLPVWRRDFAAMKNAGVNLLRTGIWTGWSLMSDRNGNPREEVLRNFEAFLLVAREHDMPVIFTFFAFLPPTWGGVNPYLDPAAVEAQKRFIGGFARCGGGVEDLAWDLINEPSFCSAQHLWECRPNYDRHEVQAWNAWLRTRHPASTDAERAARLAEAWRCTPEDVSPLPTLDDFRDGTFFTTRHPMKAAEYKLFAQHIFNGWVDELSSAIRENGNPRQMITVGQDEGGAFDRPAPQFHADRVDFTSVHTWWFNDDLLWDCVVTRPPGKPHLVEETGAMWYERTDGTPWRSEGEVARLIERKMALAFAGGGAGFVQWIWNTNPFMNSDNEAAIGFFRVDGTAKPEFRSFRGLALWMQANKALLGGREAEDVVLVVPQSLLFSARDLATPATRVAVRSMEYECGVGVRAVGEHQLAAMASVPRLVLLPSPGLLTRHAWDHLVRLANGGATILITGAFDEDESGIPTGRMKEMGVQPGTVPVSGEEWLEIDGVTYRVRYRGERNQKILKAGDPGAAGRLLTVTRGKGTILWSPLPLELSDDNAPLLALYRHALRAASLGPEVDVEGDHHGILVRSVTFADALLSILVNESSRRAVLTLTRRVTGFSFPATVAPGAVLFVLTRRRESGEISRWPG